MSIHGLPGSFSEQSYGLDTQHGLPNSFSEQIDDTDNGDFPLADKMINESRKNVPNLANQSRKRMPTGKVPSAAHIRKNSRPSQKRRCGQYQSSSEAIATPDSAAKVIDLTVDVEHCAARHPHATKLTESQPRRRKPGNKPAPTCRRPMGNTRVPSYLDIRQLVSGCGHLADDAERLTALREMFSTRKRIVVVSGASISVNAGSENSTSPIHGIIFLI
jgi:hypothetical protein